MKIGLLSQWYEPETGSAAHPTAIARALQERGHQVRVLTAFPSYPSGKVHSGYRMRLTQDEIRDGVELRRVPDLPSHDENALRRSASLTSFALSAATRVRWLRDSDVVLVYLSPATVGLAPYLLQRLAGVPYVLYVQDLWPETITASGFIGHERLSRTVERMLAPLLSGLYRNAAGVVAISPSMAATLADRGAPLNVVSIPNWVDEIFAPAHPGQSSGEDWGDRTWIMYAGGIGELQALHHAVRAMALLDGRTDIGLAFVGDGVARADLEHLAQSLHIADRVRFLGSRPMGEMPTLMGETAAQLISLKDLPLFRGTVPSKLQAAMACAAPVICAVAGDAATLVGEAGAGMVVPPEDPGALAAAFEAMADLPSEDRRALGLRGRDYYRSELSADVGARRLEEVLLRAQGQDA